MHPATTLLTCQARCSYWCNSGAWNGDNRPLPDFGRSLHRTEFMSNTVNFIKSPRLGRSHLSWGRHCYGFAKMTIICPSNCPLTITFMLIDQCCPQLWSEKLLALVIIRTHRHSTIVKLLRISDCWILNYKLDVCDTTYTQINEAMVKRVQR